VTDAARLDAIEKRCNEATYGPWHMDEYETEQAGMPAICNDNGVVLLVDDVETAAFIAAARTDIPYLLPLAREALALRAENARLRKVESAAREYREAERVVAIATLAEVEDRAAGQDANASRRARMAASAKRGPLGEALDAALASPAADAENQSPDEVTR
jgi:hypothetical protein